MPHVESPLAELPVQRTGRGSFVRLRNVGPHTWVDKYDNRRYTIPAGSETLVPYEAAVLWLGDPNARDVDARNRHRTDEWFRLRVRYGVYDKEHLFAEQGPKLEMYTLDGERLVTVADDPYLERFDELRAGGLAGDDAIAALTAQVAELQAQIDRFAQGAPTAPVAPTLSESPLADRQPPSDALPPDTASAASASPLPPEPAGDPDASSSLPPDTPKKVRVSKS